MNTAAWKAVLACLVIGLAVSSAIPLNSEALDAWESFVHAYDKSYSTEQEYQQRKEIFLENYQKIQEQNEKFQSGESTAEYGVTRFTDLTTEEFIKTYTGALSGERPSIPEEEDEHRPPKRPLVGAPANYDSRNVSYILPKVKDQGQCGSCYAFSAINALEAAYNKKKGALAANLSEQQIVDCDPKNGGCNGGIADYVFNYIMGKVIATEAAYPYKGVKQTSCKSSLGTSTFTNFRWAFKGQPTVEDLKTYVSTYGSIVAEMDATPLQNYKSGILNFAACTTTQYTNHYVNLIGYYTTNGSTPYFVYRNSWGAGWGEKGHFKVAMGSSCGMRVSAYLITYN